MLYITLFGGFSLVYNQSLVTSCNASRLQSLLAYLLLHRHTPQSRQHLAFCFWPDAPEEKARSSLRNLTYQLRHALPEANTYLFADALTLRWQLDTPFKLDVAEFEDALLQANEAADGAEKRRWLETAVALYKGDLLPGNYEEWLIPFREEQRHAFCQAVSQLVDHYEQAGDYQAAALHAQRLVQLNPLDEATTVRLMRLHARRGDRTGVQRAYTSSATALQDELGIEPAPATRQAYTHYLQQAAPVAEPELPALRLPALPRPTSTLIDREKEMAQIVAHLADPDCHLLTLIGPGGMGKTRLALAAAHDQQTHFAHGALFVPLSALTDPDLVPQTLADIFGLVPTGRTTVQQHLLHYLADKELLLVLDNLEHLPEAAALMGEILAAAPGVKMIVTSRERLHLPQEWVFDLDGLPLPGDDGDWVEDSAATLFLQRARRAQGNFVPTPADRQAILTICRLVSGMPLALELAAAWVRVLTATEIAGEIARDLNFLATPSRHIPERHQSLRAVFDHSWRLLSDIEQRLLAQLSLFRGGFTRDAAAVVANLPGGPAILPLLVTLIDKSLLRRTSQGRYDLHDLIRQYAATRLNEAAAEAQVSQQRHATYYLTWMQKQLPRLHSGQQKEVLREINPDLNNIRAAWQWAVDQAHITLLQESAWVLWYYLDLRNLYSESVSLLLRAEEAIQRLRDTADNAQPETLLDQCELALSHLRIWRAFSGLRLGHIDEMRRLLQDSLVTLRRHNDQPGLGDGLWVFGILSWLSGDFAVAVQALEEGIELNHALARPWQTNFTTIILGAVRHEQGAYAEAYTLLSQGLAMAQVVGVPRNIIFALGLLARTAQALGYRDDIQSLMRENLRVAVEMEDNSAIAYALENLALAVQASGDPVGADSYFQQAIALHTEIADLWSASRTLSYAGQLALEQNELQNARHFFTRALQTALEAQFQPYALDALGGLAEINKREGNTEAALLLAAAVTQHPATSQVSKDRAAGIQTELQAQITPQQLSCAQEQAQAMTFEAVAAMALGQ